MINVWFDVLKKEKPVAASYATKQILWLVDEIEPIIEDAGGKIEIYEGSLPKEVGAWAFIYLPFEGKLKQWGRLLYDYNNPMEKDQKKEEWYKDLLGEQKKILDKHKKKDWPNINYHEAYWHDEELLEYLENNEASVDRLLENLWGSFREYMLEEDPDEKWSDPKSDDMLLTWEDYHISDKFPEQIEYTGQTTGFVESEIRGKDEILEFIKRNVQNKIFKGERSQWAMHETDWRGILKPEGAKDIHYDPNDVEPYGKR